MSAAIRTGILLAAALCPLRAFAENPDRFYVSGDAALQGGAITADTQGGGSLWYNPAGLATMTGSRLDASMNAYSFRFGEAADIDGKGDGTAVTQLQKFEFDISPSSFTLTKNLGEFSLGFGVFVPRERKAQVRTRVAQAPTQTSPGIDLLVSASGQIDEYILGPAIAWRPGPHLQLGLSLFGYVRKETDSGFASLGLPGLGFYSSSSESLEWTQAGAQPAIGLRWVPAPDWRVGMVVRLPALRFFQMIQRVTTTTIGTAGGAGQDVEVVDTQGISFRLLRPGRFHLGISHTVGKYRIAVDGSYQPPFSNEETGDNFRGTFAGRIGGKIVISPTLAVGGGLFVSPSTVRSLENFGDSKVDYVGLTLAVDMQTPYVITSKEGTPMPAGSTLIFGSTLAATYGVGFGSVLRAAAGYDPAAPAAFQTIPSDVIAHEIVLSIGSSLAE